MPNTGPLKKLIRDSIQAYQPVPDAGAVVAVIKNRKLHIVVASGQRDRASRQKVEPKTLFAIGSNTKAFTSMAMSMLAEDGKVRLDAPIIQALPEFGMQDGNAQKKMTLEDVLSHSTGLPRHDALWYLGPFSRPQLLYRLRDLDPNSKPGAGFRKSFEYNNMTYLAATAILESVTNQQWEDFVKARIIGPLKMRSTSFTVADFERTGNCAKGYLGKTELALKDFENIGPSAEINSNIFDMTAWVLLHLKRGVGPGDQKLISPARLDKMYEGFIDVEAGVKYGLGWFVRQLNNRRFVFHTGMADGYTSYVSFMPDDGLGVIVMSNQHTSEFPSQVANDIYKNLLSSDAHDLRSAHEIVHRRLTPPLAGGLPGQARRTQRMGSAAAKASRRRSTRMSKTSAHDYAGMFSNPGYGDMSVSVRGKSTSLTYYKTTWPLDKVLAPPPGAPPELFLISIEAYGQTKKVPVIFGRNSAGRIDKLAIPFEPEVKPIEFGKR